MIQPWPCISSQPLADYRIFRIRSDLKRSPRTGRDHDFYVIDTAPWVNVVAVTPDDHLVMVEQYRHGSRTVELEIPGGMMDPDDPSPQAAGERELREETGFVGREGQVIGAIYPNPAIMSNTCYTVLVRQCERRHAVEFDPAEDVVTRLVPLPEIPRLVAEGRVKHALVVVALYHFDLLQRNGSPLI
jgi:8-oxo-dGTP pyrophosphatase MutT (NUDIX family)